MASSVKHKNSELAGTMKQHNLNISEITGSLKQQKSEMSRVVRSIEKQDSKISVFTDSARKKDIEAADIAGSIGQQSSEIREMTNSLKQQNSTISEIASSLLQQKGGMRNHRSSIIDSIKQEVSSVISDISALKEPLQNLATEETVLKVTGSLEKLLVEMMSMLKQRVLDAANNQAELMDFLEQRRTDFDSLRHDLDFESLKEQVCELSTKQNDMQDTLAQHKLNVAGNHSEMMDMLNRNEMDVLSRLESLHNGVTKMTVLSKDMRAVRETITSSLSDIKSAASNPHLIRETIANTLSQLKPSNPNTGESEGLVSTEGIKSKSDQSIYDDFKKQFEELSQIAQICSRYEDDVTNMARSIESVHKEVRQCKDQLTSKISTEITQINKMRKSLQNEKADLLKKYRKLEELEQRQKEHQVAEKELKQKIRELDSRKAQINRQSDKLKREAERLKCEAERLSEQEGQVL